mgnify:CR=1 FL=1
MFDQRPIYGHIRFSFYGVTDTRLKPDADGTALARLYDETRMARRFFLFENLTLPSLLAQTDRDFRTVIMSSTVMPDRFKDRLSALAARLPGSMVEYSPYETGDKAFRKIMAQAAGFLGRLDPRELALVRTQVARSLNAPVASSAGRLFDAAAANPESELLRRLGRSHIVRLRSGATMMAPLAMVDKVK